MDVAQGSAIERIARVLAARRLSSNADGDQPSASPDVDDAWHSFRDDALAVLKTLREPDERMAAAGDAAVWERMVLAALPESDTDPTAEVGTAFGP